MFEIRIRTTQQTERMLDELPDEFTTALKHGIRDSLLFAEDQAKMSFGKAGHLNVRTGHLRRSIKSSVNDRMKRIVGRLYSDVIYAGIHEHGGVIRAKNAPFLKFKIGDRWIQKKEVRIPARPYLEPSIYENIDEIADIIVDTIEKEIS